MSRWWESKVPHWWLGSTNIVLPVLYLRSFSTISRFFSFVAWATLALWMGALAFSLAFVGA